MRLSAFEPAEYGTARVAKTTGDYSFRALRLLSALISPWLLISEVRAASVIELEAGLTEDPSRANYEGGTFLDKVELVTSPGFGSGRGAVTIAGPNIGATASAISEDGVGFKGATLGSFGDIMTFRFDTGGVLNPLQMGVVLRFEYLLTSNKGVYNYTVSVGSTSGPFGSETSRQRSSNYSSYPAAGFAENELGLTNSAVAPSEFRYYTRLDNITLVSGTIYTGTLNYVIQSSSLVSAGDTNLGDEIYDSQLIGFLNLMDYALFDHRPLTNSPESGDSVPPLIPPTTTPTSAEGFDYSSIPEPSAGLLALAGLAAFAGRRCRPRTTFH